MSRIVSAILLVVISCSAFGQNLSLRINEIVASNQAGQMDDFFEYDDWVEIYNPPGSPITNLAGYYISDDPLDLMKWQIASDDAGVTTILPNNFKILWIDDDYNNLNSQGPDHNANFTLSTDGETFLLTAPDGVTIIDSVTYPMMAPDISYGRVCDGCADWQYFNNVTFEDNNAEIHNTDLLFINEVQTNNISTYDDPEHEFDQWFEIYNPNSFQVNVGGYYVSVNGDPLQFQIPTNAPYRTVIPAGGFLLMWCDNDLADAANHTSFLLEQSGTIVMTGPDGSTPVDSYSYANIPDDVSYGRQSDGSPLSINFDVPTPSVSNSLIIIQPQNLVINEVLTANQTDTLDNLNELEDWFEIYNPNNFDINIGGYYFTDDPEVRNKWMVPTSFPDSVIVPANGWLLFWADGDVEQGVRHADFRLSNNGEYLGFSSPDGFTLVDEIEWAYIAPDTSLGRETDGSENWILFTGTTPEYSNGAGTINILEAGTSSMSLYPNPTDGLVFFDHLSDITVYDLSGALILQEKNVLRCDLGHLNSGVYLMRNERGEIARVLVH